MSSTTPTTDTTTTTAEPPADESFYFTTSNADLTPDPETSARASLARVDDILREVAALPKTKFSGSKSIVEYIREVPGSAPTSADDPAEFANTTLRRAIERAPPLADRAPLAFDPLPRHVLEAAFTLELGGVSTQEKRDLEHTRREAKKRRKEAKRAKKERKRAKRDAAAAAGGAATADVKAEDVSE